MEKSGVFGLLGRGWASSPLSVVPRPAPLWHFKLLCASDDGERLELLSPSFLSSIQFFEIKIPSESQK